MKEESKALDYIELSDGSDKKESVVIESGVYKDLLRKSEIAMSAALRIASLAYQSGEMRNLLMLDKKGECWMEQISEGFSAVIDMQRYEKG